MGYKIYDNNIKKYPFTDDAPYSTEKSAKRDIVATIYGAFSTGQYDDAIYYFDNYVVKKTPVTMVSKKGVSKRGVLKKGVGKKSPAPKKVFGRPKK